MVDGAQGAGMMDLDVERLNISMLAVPGHKGLLGPLGNRRAVCCTVGEFNANNGRRHGN